MEKTKMEMRTKRLSDVNTSTSKSQRHNPPALGYMFYEFIPSFPFLGVRSTSHSIHCVDVCRCI